MRVEVKGTDGACQPAYWLPGGKSPVPTATSWYESHVRHNEQLAAAIVVARAAAMGAYLLHGSPSPEHDAEYRKFLDAVRAMQDKLNDAAKLLAERYGR